MMSAAAREFARERSWEHALEPLYRSYREVAGLTTAIQSGSTRSSFLFDVAEPIDRRATAIRGHRGCAVGARQRSRRERHRRCIPEYAD